MRILIAGIAGELGSSVANLLKHTHDVVGLTRSEARARELEKRGMQAVVGDLLNEAATAKAVAMARPEAIVHVPIALPERGPMRPRDLTATTRLRVAGTRHILNAAIDNGVKRIVAESIVAIYGYGDNNPQKLTEESPTQTSAPFRSIQPALDALHVQENMVLDAARTGHIEGIVVRLGFYYGAGVGSTRFMVKLLRRGVMPVTRKRGAMPWIELSDASTGVAATLEAGRSAEIYNIVGDQSAGLTDLAHEIARQLGTRPPRELPSWVIRLGGRYAALMSETQLHVSNEKAKRELGWMPRYPTIKEGVAKAVAHLWLASQRVVEIRGGNPAE